MIYFVTTQRDLFGLEGIEYISVEQSLNMLREWSMIQFDSETNGKDPRICDFLLIQFGDIEGNNQIVVDTTTINVRLYKDILEEHYIIGQNLKFDLQFLFNYDIIPRKVYDTMIVEQFLYLGTPVGIIKYSLKDILLRRCGIDIDKSIRGEIIWRGIDLDVVNYAAHDVKYLGKIMHSQLQDLAKVPNAMIGAKLECDFTPVIAYLEWCGIKLDIDKWKRKMKKDNENLSESLKKLNDYCVHHPKLKKFTIINTQGDLFEGYDLTPKFNIDWQKDEAKKVFKALGFNIETTSKITGKDTESVTEKLIASQKGIDDKFLELYLDYQGFYKVTTSFGKGHLNAVNPKTGRIHTIYRALGTVSGRMSSGSEQINTDLAKLKGLPVNPTQKQIREGLKCSYPNLQQLPHDKETRGCFVSEDGNLFCSCDYSAMEARIGADVYNERKLLDEFLYGSGDTHAAYAKTVFSKELEGIETKNVKKERPDLRDKVKPIEFAVQFGSDGTAVASQLKIPVQEARQLVINLLNGMTGLKSFKDKWSKFVLNNGYMVIMPQTGHRGYWHDWKHWKEVQASYTAEFWEEYKQFHKGTGDAVCEEVRKHFKAKSKWCDRMSLNLPTQGGGAVVLKDACITWFNWVVDNGYFRKVLLVNLTHDEINTEFPEELKDFYPNMMADIMQKSAAKYYHKLPIPASAEVGKCWIH